MTTAQISGITPPPSVEAVLGALTEETRIGQVDFSTRLAPEVEETVEEREVVVDEAFEAPVLTVAEIVGAAEHDDDELAAGAPDEVEVRRAPVVEPEPEVEAAQPALAPKPAPRQRRRLGWRAPQADTPATQEATREAPARPTRVMVPPPAEVLAQVVEQPADAPEVAVLHPLGAPVPTPDVADLVAADLASGPVATPTASGTQSLRLVDERPPTVEELARLVVERLHDAELAMMRHLEAMEAEADRRVELATAQAELDADLIRLNARREAHEIIAAARRAAGEKVEEDPAERAVSEVSMALGRFADVMEELRPPRYRTMP